MKGRHLKIFVALMTAGLLLGPLRVSAVPESVIGAGQQAAIEAAIKAATAIPSVPTTDTVVATKEVKMCFWGICIPGLDKIAISITKHFIERMVDSTVDWINSGFDGNPAYVTDPERYFADIADGVAGEFIQGSSLGALCSPFQAQIRISLAQEHRRADPFQCTLTEVVGNIEAFYDDFSQGGWDAWFAMTQGPSNNPYGAYLEAKIEMDNRIASAIGLKREQLSWNSGFLGTADCIERDEAGECKKYGPTKTPGKVIESQLENVLGTNVRQLELADEFDELVSALLGQLLSKTIFSNDGLFGNNYSVDAGPRDNTTTPTEENSCGAPLPLPPGSAPNGSAVVNAVAADSPEFLARSAYTFEFLDEVVRRLQAQDPNWGYNGKRGDPNNISLDAIAYRSDPSNLRNVHIFDIIGGHGGPNPQPAWQDVTAETYNCGTTGIYVQSRPNNSTAPQDDSSDVI